MPLRYHDPATVAEPSAFLTAITVLYDGGADGFSLARVLCEGVEHIAMRWNVGRRERDDAAKQAGEVVCVGTPSVKGAPSWFILPRELWDPALFATDNELRATIMGRLADSSNVMNS